ncbi:hypothetical protein [Sphingomonas oryzagri]|uniref:XRE family transcriptional regulator n=1 Tax=Sphingomonas oryzagri TaxID=3042314 RepID=A0ABT6N7S8_9SPHN|nr:hypothetical protein [Sphingomonas oryzagri]MDH7641171.1 hypothetical protein [Sphingomonas oryzagri]
MIRVLSLDERREHLGAYVQHARIAHGASINVAAERMARNAGTARHHGLILGMIEAGRHLPSAAYIDRIAEAFPINRRVMDQLCAPNAVSGKVRRNVH